MVVHVRHVRLVRVRVHEKGVVAGVRDVLSHHEGVVSGVRDTIAQYYRVAAVVACVMSDGDQLARVGGGGVVPDGDVVVAVVAGEVPEDEVTPLALDIGLLHAFVTQIDVFAPEGIVEASVAAHHGVVGGAHRRPKVHVAQRVVPGVRPDEDVLVAVPQAHTGVVPEDDVLGTRVLLHVVLRFTGDDGVVLEGHGHVAPARRGLPGKAYLVVLPGQHG